MKRAMPAIDLDAVAPPLTPAERELATRILHRGRLRASKPPIAWQIVTGADGIRRRYPDQDGGRAAYLWRIVAFSLSPDPRHQCLPICADLDLPEQDHDRRRALAAELDALADRIVATIPRHQW